MEKEGGRTSTEKNLVRVGSDQGTLERGRKEGRVKEKAK